MHAISKQHDYPTKKDEIGYRVSQHNTQIAQGTVENHLYQEQGRSQPEREKTINKCQQDDTDIGSKDFKAAIIKML